MREWYEQYEEENDYNDQLTCALKSLYSLGERSQKIDNLSDFTF